MGDFIFNEKGFGDAMRLSGKGLHRKELVLVFIQKRVWKKNGDQNIYKNYKCKVGLELHGGGKMPNIAPYIIGKWLGEKLTNKTPKENDPKAEYFNKLVENPDQLKQEFITGKISKKQFNRLYSNRLLLESIEFRKKLELAVKNKTILEEEYKNKIETINERNNGLYKLRRSGGELNTDEVEQWITEYRKLKTELD